MGNNTTIDLSSPPAEQLRRLNELYDAAMKNHDHDGMRKIKAHRDVLLSRAQPEDEDPERWDGLS
jgi:hypothetical protein